MNGTFGQAPIKVLGQVFAIEVEGRAIAIKPHHLDAVKFMLRKNTRDVIAAIKFLRAEYGLSLRNAKQLADYLRDEMEANEERARMLDERFAISV